MSELIGNVLLVGLAVIILGGLGVVVFASVAEDTAHTPTIGLEISPRPGASHLEATFVSGSPFRLEEASIFVHVDGEDRTGALTLASGSADGRFHPGDRLRIALDGPPLEAGDEVLLLVAHKETGRSMGSARARILDQDSLPPYSTAMPSIVSIRTSNLPVPADGATRARVVVTADSTFGLGFVDRVIVNLSSVGGSAETVLRDDGLVGDDVAGDGEFSVEFPVIYSFRSNPTVEEVKLPIRVFDVLGHSANGTASLAVRTPPASKVVAGATYRNLPSSDAVGLLNLTNFSFRDPARLDNDQVEIHVSDLSTSGVGWTALVTFGYTSCSATPSITSVRLTRDGMEGSALYAPASGCFAVDADAQLDLAALSSSRDANGATAAWSVTGDAALFDYSSAGLGPLTEAIVTFVGDSVSPSPGTLGLGPMDLEWRSTVSGSLAAPTGVPSVVATRGDRQVALEWAAPASDGGSPISAYLIYRGTTSGSLVLLDTIGSNRSYVAAGLTNGQEYHFAVSAANVVGEGPRSPEASATPGAIPQAPQGLSAAAGNAQVLLAWTPPADTGGFPITGYRLYRATGTGGLVTFDTIGTNTSYVAAQLANGITYRFAVSAITAMGEGARSTEASATPATVPGPPLSMSSTRGDAQVSLSWAAPSSDGGSAIISYRIHRSTSSGAPQLIDTIGTNTSYIAAGLTNGVTYFFQVSAVNSVGEGQRGAETSATPATVPSIPLSLAASPGDRTVTLSWSAPATDGGSPLAGYRIYRGTTSGSLTLLQSIGTNTTYISAGLTNGVEYYYQVTASNAVGEGGPSGEITATPQSGATVPGAPQGVSASRGNTLATLSWSAPASDGGSPITAYRIYRGTTSGSLVLLDTIGTNTTYTAAGLSNGQTYYFSVAAVNAIGQGSRSAETSVVPATTPSAPPSLSTTRGDGQVGLSWAAPASTGGSTITGYRVYRGTTSGSLTLIDTIGTNTSYVSAGLTNGVTYLFQVSAINDVGEGTRAPEVAAVPATTPPAPVGLSATAGNAQVSLTWAAPPSDGGSAITGYRVYRGTATGSLTILQTIGTNTSYVAAGLTNGVTYYFQVSALNAMGEGARSAEATAIPATVPDAPRSLSATRGDQYATLTWTAPATDGGAPVSAYRIYRGTLTGSLVHLDTIGANTSYVAAGLTNGVTYHFQVSAVNSVGEGVRSAEASATPATTPSAPSSLTATRGNAQVTLSWTAPSSTGGSPITSYRIYRGTLSGSLTLLDTIGTNTSYIAAGLANGVTYHFQVSAVNAIGEGARSSEASATPATTPGAPLSLGATRGDAQTTLTWSAPSSDGGSSITAYRIYRGTLSGSLTLLDTVGTNTSYVAAGLTNGVTYLFQVSAVSAVGEGSRTAEVAATPATTPSQPGSFTATGGNAQAALSWAAPASNGGAAITSYRIYRGTSSGSLSLIDTIGTNTSYVAAGLTNGVTYFFQVSAVNSVGEGPRAPEASATPATTPAAPQALAAVAGANQVTLTWSAPASNGGSPVTTYRIYRGTVSGSLTLIDTLGTNTSYVAAGLTNGVTYFFQVSAANALGEGPRAAEVSGTPTVPDVTFDCAAPTSGSVTSCANLQSDADSGAFALLTESSGNPKTYLQQMTGTGSGIGGSSWTLHVRARQASNAESLAVQVSSNGGSTWRTVVTVATTSTTILTGSLSSAEFNGGATLIRFADASTVSGGSDPNTSTWEIDYVKVVIG